MNNSPDYRTEEDERVDEDKWMYREKYEDLVTEGKLIGHKGNPDGIVRSTYWPDKKGLNLWEKPGSNQKHAG